MASTVTGVSINCIICRATCSLYIQSFSVYLFIIDTQFLASLPFFKKALGTCITKIHHSIREVRLLFSKKVHSKLNIFTRKKYETGVSSINITSFMMVSNPSYRLNRRKAANIYSFSVLLYYKIITIKRLGQLLKLYLSYFEQ